MRPEDCLAIHQGELRLRGLDGPVRIVRDRWGVPHIRAGSAADALFAQGFCLGQDRAWQLELLRHMARGRAAALLNRGLLALDRQNRLLGFGRLADEEWGQQSPEARRALEAYAAGVNAALASGPPAYEFTLLGHTMAPWAPADSLAIIKMVNSGAQWAAKLKFGQIAATLGEEALRAAVPGAHASDPVIVPAGTRWATEAHPFGEAIAGAMGEAVASADAAGGSNCWVMHGSLTASGAPLVAGDPHLPVSLPGQWYVLHMECPEFTAAGPCNPGYPGPLFYGHNTQVAWTMTHAQGDRWDLYRERVRQGPSGPEALFRDTWEPLAVRDETFAVREGEPVTQRLWATRHGPVIAGDPERDGEVVAARWGLAEPCHDLDALLAMLAARDASGARAALRRYESVSGNFCFADTRGSVGYQYTGRIPRRPAWLVPVPGWDGAHEWAGSVPAAELPAEEDPAGGYLLTANNRTTLPGYPHYLSYMATPFRAARLRELIEARSAPVDAAWAAQLQRDCTSTQARDMAATLCSYSLPPGEGAALQDLLRGWEGELGAGSAAALAFDAVCGALSGRTVRRFYAAAEALPTLTAIEERRMLGEQLLARAPLMLAPGETWEAAVTAAFAEAAATLRTRHGPDCAGWRWDAVHAVHWRHNLGRDAAFAHLNLPPVPVGGDSSTPFCTASDLAGAVFITVSYRQVIDLADLDSALVCIPPGNSGQPGSPHYGDNLERWRSGAYHPLHVAWESIEAVAETTLLLVPGAKETPPDLPGASQK